MDVRPYILVNDTTGALAAVTSGLGITPTTSWAARPELRSGTLEQLFRDWTTASVPVHAFFPEGRTARIAARVFVDYFRAALELDPPAPLA